MPIPSPDVTPDTIRVHDRTFRPYISRDEIAAMVANIAERVNADHAGRELTVIVILKGAMIFAADLVRHLRIPCRIETLRASSYGSAMRTSGMVDLEQTLPNIEGRHVLIVEDIVDTGTTITELIKVLGSSSPAGITVAALLSKPDMHRETLAIDYVGREIAPDFVVGYGLDYAGYGRELDAIWVVTDTTTETLRT